MTHPPRVPAPGQFLDRHDGRPLLRPLAVLYVPGRNPGVRQLIEKLPKGRNNHHHPHGIFRLVGANFSRDSIGVWSVGTSQSERGFAMAPFEHDPVMVQEILDFFDAAPAGVYVDATLGAGGHAEALLNRRSDMTLLGIDRDPNALENSAARLDSHADRVALQHARFDQFASVVASHGERPITAVLFDLGVSSPQLDIDERGFSFRESGPLDMRMNPHDTLTAADIVNTWDERRISDLIRDGADERFARRIAAAIVAQRPFHDTVALAEVVREAIPAATRRTGGHPAKRTFQALRIVVNDELDQISPALNQAIDALAPGGRGAVLSYHSGEDRIVKAVIAKAEDGGCQCPSRLPCGCGAVGRVTVPSPRSKTPTSEELERNPRSRSARLRCFVRREPQS